MCKKIHRGGNAEQYNADKKYKEAVAVAVEACAEDTKGQTYGEEHRETLIEADNYALTLIDPQHFEEARSLTRTMLPVTRRVFGASHDATIRMSRSYAKALYRNPAATLAELREAVTTLEDTTRIARRVLGGAHPLTIDIEDDLQDARAALYARGLP